MKRRIEYVVVPGGEFLMGGVPQDKFVTAVELPRRAVRVGVFAMSVDLVTRGSWQEIMGGDSPFDPDLPVTRVDFGQAEAFARLAGARLPTEIEWEYACRGGSADIFPCGGDITAEHANFLHDECGQRVGPGALTRGGTYPPNGFGLHDMTGNACEWTADCWCPSHDAAPVGGRRVIRGGAWDHLPRLLRASWRDWAPEDARWDNLGFRIVRDL